MTLPASRTYHVLGMTCSHCVLSVREEVSEVEGVDSVDVELASGLLTVTGKSFDDGAVRAAVADGHDDSIGFEATFPTTGRHRLFLQFKHEGSVHTAAFTEGVR